MSSWMTVSSTSFDDVKAEYQPAWVTEYGTRVPASVWIDLEEETRGSSSAHLHLSIENARTLASVLPQILMLHDAAERLAAEKAVA